MHYSPLASYLNAVLLDNSLFLGLQSYFSSVLKGKISVKTSNENPLNFRQTCAMPTRLYTAMGFQMNRSLSWCTMTLLIMTSKWWTCTSHKLYGYYQHTIVSSVFSVCSSFVRKAFKTTSGMHWDVLSISTITLIWNVLMSCLRLTPQLSICSGTEDCGTSWLWEQVILTPRCNSSQQINSLKPQT